MKEGDCMKLTEAQKKANRKWDKENMVTLACHVRKEQAEKFKDFTGKFSTIVLQTIGIDKFRFLSFLIQAQ